MLSFPPRMDTRVSVSGKLQTLPSSPADDLRRGDWEQQLIPHFVRAEANLLRLPLFALHTKRLKTLDGIECSGRITRNGETHQFRFRATRNTAGLYPGPQARAVHLAFLSIITEQGMPLHNPITWGWRDLCRRMKIEYGGHTVHQLKDAILSTAGLLIHSEYALYSKTDGQPICTREDALHLYERVAFIGSQLPDGSAAETNHLWLSEWYVNNLNAMFTAPLDYALWQFLNENSPIASRLYEFLLVNFYSAAPVLRINYETLTRFLPIRPEHYRSDARRQLEPAFELLKSTGILSAVAWADSKEGLAQLHLYRGRLLAAAPEHDRTDLPFTDEEFAGGIEVKELRNLRPPEADLVTDFYRLWTGNDNYHPTKKEKEQAAQLIAEHGQVTAKALIPLVVKHLRQQWPDAKSFGAILKYLPEAVQEHNHLQKQAERRRQEQLRDKQEREQTDQKSKQRAKWKVVWDTLSQETQEAIRRDVVHEHSRMSLEKFPTLLEGFCLDELAHRHGEALPKS